jgi:anti-anti-sigma factor
MDNNNFTLSAYQVEDHTDVLVINFTGTVDLNNYEEFHDQLSQIFKDYPAEERVVLNIEKLKFINSMAIGVIAQFHVQAIGEQRELIVAGGAENVLLPMEMIGIFNLMPHYQSLDEAIAGDDEG